MTKYLARFSNKTQEEYADFYIDKQDISEVEAEAWKLFRKKFPKASESDWEIKIEEVA